MLRYSVRVAAPGCMALVLEAVEDRAPYQLENRTPHPLLYRPALAPEPGQAPLEFQPLPPWSCVGYAPAVPGGLQRVCAWLTPPLPETSEHTCPGDRDQSMKVSLPARVSTSLVPGVQFWRLPCLTTLLV